jgi:hypothetical protein
MSPEVLQCLPIAYLIGVAIAAPSRYSRVAAGMPEARREIRRAPSGILRQTTPPDGKSPSGPHTHVLPKLLSHGRTHPATEPLPHGWVPCAYCYPPNPVRDGHGRSRPFDAESHFASLAMLERYGDPERLMLKKRLIYSVMAGEEPFANTRGNDRFDRATVRVTLRQLQAPGARSATLAAWLAAYDHGESTRSDVPPERTRPRVSVLQSDGK